MVLSYRGLEKLGRVTMLFVMLDDTYNTDSQPERVHGWLGRLIDKFGGVVWYPSWTKFQTVSAADEINSVNIIYII